MKQVDQTNRPSRSGLESPLNRRSFLKTAAQVSAAMLVPQIVPGSVLGRDGGVAPSERIVMGGIGIGNRGSYVLDCFLPQQDVQFVAVCDIKETRRQAVKKRADGRYNNQDCATYRDLRELLARSDIDAVLIATGPNWHATASILAAKAGKDVYCEKPCTKNIAQSLALRDTFRRHATPEFAEFHVRDRSGPVWKTWPPPYPLCPSRRVGPRHERLATG
jgi:hypothetical protein